MLRKRTLQCGMLVFAVLACPGDRAAQSGTFYSKNQPVIYMNDQPDDTYTDAYIMALASIGEIQLVGMVSSGVDCECGAGDNYPITDTPRKRQEWINAARKAGFRNIPDNVNGTQGPKLRRPSSGIIEQTQRIGSPGTDLIVREARKATRERPLLVVSGGPLTTVADAYLHDPSIAGKVDVTTSGGINHSNGEMNDWNLVSDGWATTIVVQKFRLMVCDVFYGNHWDNCAYVPDSRLRAELPDCELRDLLLSTGYYWPGYDGDGPPAQSVGNPAVVAEARRVVFDRYEWVRCWVRFSSTGDDFVTERLDGNAATTEWWRAVKKAFAGTGIPPVLTVGGIQRRNDRRHGDPFITLPGRVTGTAPIASSVFLRHCKESEPNAVPVLAIPLRGSD